MSVDGQVAAFLKRATVFTTSIAAGDVAIITDFAFVQLAIPAFVKDAGLCIGVGSATAAKRTDNPRRAGNAVTFHAPCCK